MADAKLTIKDLPTAVTVAEDADLLALWDDSDNTTSQFSIADLKTSVIDPQVSDEAALRTAADSDLQDQIDLKAPLDSPSLTGIPLVPTATNGTNTDQAASTAFVQDAVSSVTGAVVSVNTRAGAVTLDASDVGLSSYAPYDPTTLPVSIATQAALDNKEGTITAGLSSQVWQGDKTWADKTGLPVSTAQQAAIDFATTPDNFLPKNWTPDDGVPVTLRSSIQTAVYDHQDQWYNGLFAATPANRAGIRNGSISLSTIFATAAATALSLGKGLMWPKGTYMSTAVLVNPGVSIDMQGSTIYRSGAGTLFQTAPTSPTLTGSLLTVNAAARATTITVSTGTAATLVVGNIYVLNSRTALISTSSTAEYVMIRGVNTGTGVVTLWWPLKYAYLTAASARLTVPPFQTALTFQNMTVNMDLTNITAGNYAFETAWQRGARFKNITVNNFIDTAIQLLCCLDVSVENCNWNYGGSLLAADNRDGTGYGISEVGLNQGLIVSNCHALSIRHLYTTGSRASTGGVPADYGEAWGSLIIGCTHTGALNMAFDVHESGRYITFYACKALDGAYAGFQTRCPHARVINCEAINMMGPALWDRGGSSGNAYADGTIVKNLLCDRTNQGLSPDGTDWTQWGAIMAEGPNAVYEDIYADSVGGAVFMIGRNSAFANNVIRRVTAINPCVLVTSGSKSVINIVATSSTSTTGLIIENVQSRDDAGFVTDVVYNASAAGYIYIRGVFGLGHSGVLVNNSTSDVNLFYNWQSSLKINREGSFVQYMDFVMNSTSNGAVSYSPTAAAKGIVWDARTDVAGTSPSGGALSHTMACNGVIRWQVLESGEQRYSGITNITADRAYVPPQFTAAQIAAIGNSVNTTNKILGKTIYDTTNSRQLQAMGATAGSGWNLLTGGAAVITPV